MSSLEEIKRKNIEDGIKYIEKDVVENISIYRKTGSIEVRNKIIKSCFPIYFQVLKKFGNSFNTSNKVLNNEDLFNECIEATIKAIEPGNFNAKKEFKFITYLWTVLIREISNVVTKHIVKHDENCGYIEIYDHATGGFFERTDISSVEIKEISLTIDQMRFILTEREMVLVELKMRGKTIKKIIEEMNISIDRYYRILSEIKSKVEKEYG